MYWVPSVAPLTLPGLGRPESQIHSTSGGAPTAHVANSIPPGLPGQAVTAPGGTTMFGPLAPADGPFGAVNIGSPCTMFCVGTNGTINGSIPLPTIMAGTMTTIPGQSNMVTISKGYPWTTGLITVAQPGAGETFWLSGTDMRVSGVGNLSLVSGGLSRRSSSGGNANRGWVRLTLPEPSVTYGAAGALAMLVFFHALLGRRSR